MPAPDPLGGAHRKERVAPRWAVAAVIVLGVAAVGAGVYTTSSVGDVEDQAQTNAVQRDAAAAQGADLAGQVLTACARGEVVQSPLGVDLCERASAVQSTPVPAVPVTGAPGTDGRPGADGRGITNTDVDPAGHLIVSYSDGTRQDLGPVVGANGTDGADGRGITDSRIVDGDLVLTYTDGTTQDLGPVVGASGRDGDEGEPGRGVASVDQQDGRLVITYTDGTTEDAGPLPPGPRGPMGPAGPTCPDGFTPSQVLFADGQVGVGCVLDDDQPTTTQPEPTLTPDPNEDG